MDLDPENTLPAGRDRKQRRDTGEKVGPGADSRNAFDDLTGPGSQGQSRNLQNLTTPISHAQDKDREEKWGPPQNWDLHDMERRVRHMWKEGAQNHMDDRPRSQE